MNTHTNTLQKLTHEGKDTTKDVTNIGGATNVGRKGAILHSHEHGSGVIKDDIAVFDGLNGLLDSIGVRSNLLSNPIPSLFDILDLVDVQKTGERTVLIPDL